MRHKSGSSDDEGEASVITVSDYRFEDENDLPVSFSVLPLSDVGNNIPKREISLYGTIDNGLRKISKQVVTWNYDLSAFVSGALISVLSKDGKWIVLGGRPLKWYGNGEARSILVTLASLHFIRRNPEVSDEALWNHMAKTFRFLNVKPNSRDFISHLDLIADAVNNDSFLSKSELLRSFLENPEKNINHVEPTVVPKFIVDDTVDYDYEPCIDENEDVEEGELFDSVCAFCDNGGFVLCCDGVCMRAFHAKGEAESQCEGIGLSKREVDAIQTFVCKNCTNKRHQCFCCGKLGISDKSKGPEVFRCSNAFCGHFYHPKCIAKLLKPEDELAQELLITGISEGESFICTIHKCAVCQGGEKKNEIDFQFAVCRRCPTAYHRKCIPKEIRFAKTDEEQNDEEREEKDDVIIYRAWENLLPNRVLIYCLKHDIIEKLGTPARGHIIFPEDVDSNGNNALERPKRAVTLMRKRYNEDEDTFKTKRQRITENSSSPLKKVMTSENESVSRKPPKVDKLPLRKVTSLPPQREKPPPIYTTKNFVRNESIDNSSMKRKSERHTKPHVSKDNTSADKDSESQIHSNANLLTEESKRRIMNLMKKSEREATLDNVLTKRQIPSIYSHSSKNMIDKVITLGKVEGAVEAVREALNKVKNGSTVDEAKAVCEPEVLNQIVKWQSKLKVYLSPFLHGSHYSSYGRHFTNVEKLEEIANILHYYVQSGDMIVDFCCGANDFSSVMRKKLEECGKKCLFKNYDIIQAKNPSNFEKRDWMTVEPHELNDGGKLIIGLNPPFGVKAALANKFINKALQFKPKLLVLIVPRDVERPNQQTSPYDIIWENSGFFSEKSFYLPGNDLHLDQWNLNTPTLVLWSRRDWVRKHISIAKTHSHFQEKDRNNKASCDEDVGKEGNNEAFCDKDVMVEKRTDVPKIVKKTAQLNPLASGERKRPVHGNLPRGLFSASATHLRREANVEESGRSYYPPQFPSQVPRGISVDSCPQLGHNVSHERGFQSYPRPLPHVQVPEQYGNIVQNSTVSGIPRQIPYPNMVPFSASGFEHRKRMSATERYASRLNDLSYNVGVGILGSGPLGRGLHISQPYKGDNTHRYRPPGASATWHNAHTPMRNNK